MSYAEYFVALLMFCFECHEKPIQILTDPSQYRVISMLPINLMFYVEK